MPNSDQLEALTECLLQGKQGLWRKIFPHSVGGENSYMTFLLNAHLDTFL